MKRSILVSIIMGLFCAPAFAQIQQSGYIATPSASTSILGQTQVAMTNATCNVVTPGSNCTVSGLSTSYLAAYVQDYYLTGSLSAPQILVVPLQPGGYHCIGNSTGQTITAGGITGATVTIPTALTQCIISHDGVNYVVAGPSSAGTTPASPSGSIQYNNSGVFGGSSNATLDSSGNVSLQGNIASTKGLLDGNKLQVAPITVAAASAVYDMRTASSTQATDTTGNGNNCVFGSGSHAPTLADGTLTFDGTQQQYCTTPISRANAQTIMMAVRLPILNKTINALSQVLFSSSDNTCPALVNFAPPPVVFIPPANIFSVSSGIINTYNPSTNTVYGTSPLPGEVEAPIPGYAIVTVVVGPSQDQWFINGAAVNWRSGRSISTSACTSGNLRFGAILNNVYDPDVPTTNGALTADSPGIIVWSFPLTNDQVASANDALAASIAAKGYIPTPQFSDSPGVYSRAITIGDSRTFGGAGGVAGQPYYLSLPSLLNNPTGSAGPAINSTWTPYDVSQPGQTMCQMADRVSLYNALYDPSATNNAAVVWGIYNDGESTQVSEGCTAALVQQLKTKGFDVFLATEIDAAGSTWETTKLDYNHWVRANWQNIGAVEVVDLGENANLGCNGCHTNTTYFDSDGIHPTSLSDTTIIAPYVAASINAYYGWTNSANIPVANGYQMLPQDRSIVVAPTAANWAVTLPVCDSLTGSTPVYSIVNFGSFPETVNGVTAPSTLAAFTISQQVNATFVAFATGETGCSWRRTDGNNGAVPQPTVNKNHVPDSDVKFGSAYWTLNTNLTIANKLGDGGTNAFSLSSSGSGSNLVNFHSESFNLVCGLTYTFSGYIDATFAVGANPTYFVADPTFATIWVNQPQLSGTAANQNTSFLFNPGGCTSGTLSPVVVAGDNAGATFTGTQTVKWSAPMLTEGIAFIPYISNVMDDDTGKIQPGALPVFTSTLVGAVPASSGGTTNFLRADGTFAAPSGSGGTVTSLTATLPIVATPTTITATGAFSCPTCLTATTPTNHGVLLGAGTQAVGTTAAGATNAVMVGQGASADPIFSATPTINCTNCTNVPLAASVPFSGVGAGTNTNALVIGTGGSLTVSGTGTINSTTLLGNTWASPAAIGGTTPSTGAFTSVTSTTTPISTAWPYIGPGANSVYPIYCTNCNSGTPFYFGMGALPSTLSLVSAIGSGNPDIAMYIGAIPNGTTATNSTHYFSATGMAVRSGSMYCWNSSATNAGTVNGALSCDTGFSRDSAGVVDCGNGTFQNKGCTFNAALGVFGTSVQIAGGIPMTGNQGTGLNVAHCTGSFTTGHLWVTDASGNCIDGGAVGGGTVTTTGSPASMYLATFSGPTAITGSNAALVDGSGHIIANGFADNGLSTGPLPICPNGAGGLFTVVCISTNVGAIISRGRTTALAGSTLFTPGITALYRINANVVCDSVVSAATVTLTITYTDPSGTSQTISPSAAACTTLGPASFAAINANVVNVLTGTPIVISTSLVGFPTYDVAATVEQLTIN